MVHSNIRYQRRILSFWFLFVIGGILLVFQLVGVFTAGESGYAGNTYGSSRKLLSVTLANCTPPAIEQFPYPFMSRELRQEGGIVIHILLGAYMFLALAIACDDYFVPACEKVCDVLNLQSDVSGATFMAAGSSAPELATSVIGVFIAKDDIGLGAVVGSAVFNIMFVISICSLFAGMVVYLHWWPMFRDSLFYTISILALVLVILDEEIQWYEASCLLVLYAVYIVVMIFNRQLEAWFVPKFSCCGYNKVDDGSESDQSELTPVKEKNQLSNHHTFAPTESDTDSDSIAPVEDTTELHTLLSSSSVALRQSFKDRPESCTPSPSNGITKDVPPMVVVKTHLDEEGEESVLSPPEGCCKRLLWLISLPLILVMYVTIPDCRTDRWKNWWLVTFLMSCIWIGAFSYLMVWMITVAGEMLRVPDSIASLTILAAGTSLPDLISSLLVAREGDVFGIPDTVMSLTFIAAGASVPDAIASLLVTRDGLGDMAVSNAIGSNVFDILVCLALPYFLKALVVNKGAPVQVYSQGLTYSSVTLLSTVLVLLVSIHLNGWKLDKKYGVFLMVLYLLFNVLAILYELNIFGYLHPPTCPSSF